jgi:hypothetical protein
MGLVMADAKLAIGKNVDIYGSDACLMQMIESAGEMKDSVDYVIGSQELEPAQGWPYFPFLRKWTAAPTMTPKELAVLLSKEYLAGYELGGVYGPKPDEEPISGITMSVLDMSKLDNLYDSLRNLTSKINSLAANDFKKIHAVSGSFLRYTSDDYVDLGQLIKTLRTLKINQINLETLDSVEASLSDVVVTTDNDANYAEATGLSIWMPTMVYNGAVTSTSYKNALKEYNKLQLRYEKLKSSLATDWGQFTKKTISTF